MGDSNPSTSDYLVYFLWRRMGDSNSHPPRYIHMHLVTFNGI